MIITRYLSREIFTITIIATLILMLIFMSNQFARYLALAAAGKMMVLQLLHLMLLEIPQLLSLILPLAFYLSILLAYGRLYIDNEMIVLNTCGLSYQYLLSRTMLFATCIAIPVFIFTLILNPIFATARNQLLSQINAASALQTLQPGRFQQANNGQRIFYVERMSSDHQLLQNVFVAEKANSIDPDIKSTWSVMSAAGGHRYFDSKTKEQFVVADNGYRYEGDPGTNNFTIIHFDQYGVRIDIPVPYIGSDIDNASTLQLLKQVRQHKLEANAELQWRIAMPLSVYILTLLALPLSWVKPRQGRFTQLFPAILLYIIYANMLIVGQDWILNGILMPTLGLWIVHIILLLLAIVLVLNRNKKWRYWWNLMINKHRATLQT